MSAIASKIAIQEAIKHRKKIAMLLLILIMAFIIIVASVLSFFQNQQASKTFEQGEIPQAVLQYQEAIQKELAKYGREEHLNLVLAITTQESGGTASLDIMQASESLGLAPNTIQDPQYSIEVGVRYFDQVLDEAENAEVDLATAVQSYNMGSGYINFVANNGGKHTTELAQQFSSQMKSRLGWNVYGDPNYIENVKRYLGEATGGGNVGNHVGDHGLQNPYIHQEGKYQVTSEFSLNRVNPVTGILKAHTGIDLAPNGSTNLSIASAGDGFVTFAGMYSDGNIAVHIQHPNGLTTKYLHLSQMPTVKINQEVKAGDIIGLTGTTGNSTGVHLHFEILEGTTPVNPRNYLTW